jgi:DNA polymerase III alpha subunit
MKKIKIITFKEIEDKESYDLEIDSKDHNFYANGIVVSNSHAAAYSHLSALTLYLKYKYPQHFYTECLRMAENKADSQDHVARIQQELAFFNIKLLPPDLINSKENFTIEGDNIRYGFSSIKGVSEKSLSAMKSFLVSPKTNKFEVFSAAENCKLNVGVVCAMIQSGMLSNVSPDRETLVFEAQVWGKLTDKEKVFCLERGQDYEYNLLLMVKNIHSWVNDAGKKIAAKTRLETIRKHCEKYKEIYFQNKKNARLASYYYEENSRILLFVKPEKCFRQRTPIDQKYPTNQKSLREAKD